MQPTVWKKILVCRILSSRSLHMFMLAVSQLKTVALHPSMLPACHTCLFKLVTCKWASIKWCVLYHTLNQLNGAEFYLIVAVKNFPLLHKTWKVHLHVHTCPPALNPSLRHVKSSLYPDNVRGMSRKCRLIGKLFMLTLPLTLILYLWAILVWQW
jgi:hypothetical protein